MAMGGPFRRNFEAEPDFFSAELRTSSFLHSSLQTLSKIKDQLRWTMAKTVATIWKSSKIPQEILGLRLLLGDRFCSPTGRLAGHWSHFHSHGRPMELMGIMVHGVQRKPWFEINQLLFQKPFGGFLSHRGTPSHHPFLDGIVHQKKHQFLGYPHDYGKPHSFEGNFWNLYISGFGTMLFHRGMVAQWYRRFAGQASASQVRQLLGRELLTVVTRLFSCWIWGTHAQQTIAFTWIYHGFTI